MNKALSRPYGLLATVAKLALAVVVLMSFAACGGGSGTDTADPQTVVLREWAVTKSLVEAPAGNLRFRVRNNGSLDHELVIVKTDLRADRLPIDDAQSVVDVGAAGELVGEIEGVASDQEKSGTFNLTPGKYVLICNITGHYQQGMRTDFMVR